MSSPVLGTTPALFDLKSATLTALALVLRSADLSALAHELAARLGTSPDGAQETFENEPVVIDLAQLPDAAGTTASIATADAATASPAATSPATAAATPAATAAAKPAGAAAAKTPADTDAIGSASVMGDLFDAEPAGPTPQAAIDWPALIALLRRHGLQAVAVRGGTPAQTRAALKAGLADAPDSAPSPRRGSQRLAPTKAPVAQEAPVREVVREVIREVIREVEVIREIPAPTPRTVVIDKPLRSGQQVYAKGADLVVLATVNHGAEVIADGNVHVYAALRGKAIAGARGNTEARIYASSLEAELVSIAGIYRTTEEPLPVAVRGKAAQVRLEGEKLIMQALGS